MLRVTVTVLTVLVIQCSYGEAVCPYKCHAPVAVVSPPVGLVSGILTSVKWSESERNLPTQDAEDANGLITSVVDMYCNSDGWSPSQRPFGAINIEYEFKCNVLTADPTLQLTTQDPSVCAAAEPTTVNTPTDTTPSKLTTKSPTTVGYDTSCICDTHKVWNDVVFVVDRSSPVTKAGFSQMIDSIITLLDPAFNVQPYGYSADNYWLNTGLVFYNSNATVALPIGSSIDDFYGINGNDYFDPNDRYSNLEAGLTVGIEQLDGTRGRPSSRKVIVVVASTYNPAGANSPILAADQFKADNGIIITYNAILLHGEPIPMLSDIASPGYYFQSQTAQFSDLVQAQCDANCFCPANSKPFGTGARGNPTNGCYPSVTFPSNERLSQRECQQNHDGILVKIENAFKNSFVGQLITPAQDTWIGLTWNTNLSSWRWVDGTPLSSYNNFIPGTAHSSGIDCVIMQKNSLYWKTVDCSVGYQYNCEQRPCDSTTWCNTIQGV